MICDQMLSQHRHLWNLVEVVQHESPFGTALADPDRLSSPVHRNPWILDNPQRPH